MLNVYNNKCVNNICNPQLKLYISLLLLLTCSVELVYKITELFFFVFFLIEVSHQCNKLDATVEYYSSAIMF